MVLSGGIQHRFARNFAVELGLSTNRIFSSVDSISGLGPFGPFLIHSRQHLAVRGSYSPNERLHYELSMNAVFEPTGNIRNVDYRFGIGLGVNYLITPLTSVFLRNDGLANLNFGYINFQEFWNVGIRKTFRSELRDREFFNKEKDPVSLNFGLGVHFPDAGVGDIDTPGLLAYIQFGIGIETGRIRWELNRISGTMPIAVSTSQFISYSRYELVAVYNNTEFNWLAGHGWIHNGYVQSKTIVSQDDPIQTHPNNAFFIGAGYKLSHNVEARLTLDYVYDSTFIDVNAISVASARLVILYRI